MRTATLALDAHAGDAVSEAYLAASLHHRVLALTDDPDTPLSSAGWTSPCSGRRRPWRGPLLLGRGHGHDDSGDPVVIDAAK